VKSAAIKILMIAFILAVFSAVTALAQKEDVHFHWSASPVMDDEGIVRPEAVIYEVWLQRGDESEQLIATVADTTYWLSVEPGISHKIRVRGLDAQGHKSKMSLWSDPVYLANGGEISTVPLGAQLKSNYPNPFNPETRIRYGVPDDLSPREAVRLEIYSLNGTRIRSLPVTRTPGWHEVAWDGKDDRGMVTPAGMYVTRFVVGTSVKTRKMTMVK
jgi:hypothetical protein